VTRVLVDTNAAISALLFRRSVPAQALSWMIDAHDLVSALDELLSGLEFQIAHPAEATSAVVMSDPNDQRSPTPPSPRTSTSSAPETSDSCWLAQGMGHAAGWMFEAVWMVFDSTTVVDVTSSQYTKVYNVLFGVAVFVMLGFFMLQVIGGMIRREPAALSRAALGLAKSILGSFVALALLAAALEITDQLCIGIVNAAGTNMEKMGDRIALLTAGLVGLNLAAPGAGAILTIFIAGLAIGAAGIATLGHTRSPPSAAAQ
jgi:hypothetical protein